MSVLRTRGGGRDGWCCAPGRCDRSRRGFKQESRADLSTARNRSRPNPQKRRKREAKTLPPILRLRLGGSEGQTLQRFCSPPSTTTHPRMDGRLPWRTPEFRTWLTARASPRLGNSTDAVRCAAEEPLAAQTPWRSCGWPGCGPLGCWRPGPPPWCSAIEVDKGNGGRSSSTIIIAPSETKLASWSSGCCCWCCWCC